MQMEILYKDKNIIAVKKAAGVPTQSDLSGDADLMSITSEYLSDGKENSSLWLIHRLDRVVGGVIVFARNKKYAALLSTLVSENKMTKEYLAIVEGEAEGGVLKDFLYKDSAKGKSFVVDRKRAGVKEAELEYTKISAKETERGVFTIVKIRLHTGRFHQIRAQFSSRGLPLVGDGKYGSRDAMAKMPTLFAARLAFCIDGKDFDVTVLPNTSEYPWSLFESEVLSAFEGEKKND